MDRLIIIPGKIPLGTLNFNDPCACIRKAARAQRRCYRLLDGHDKDAR
jgi:hypothetical protein